MKIPSYRPNFMKFDGIRPKQEGEGGQNGSGGYQSSGKNRTSKPGSSAESGADQSQDDPEGTFEEILAVTEKKVADAIDAFQSEASQNAGIQVAMQGSGVGLRVVLKDVSGTVVRQLTGDEFLKLRDGSSVDLKARGKILDRKM